MIEYSFVIQEKELLHFLKENDRFFSPKLSKRINLYEYSKKIFNKGLSSCAYNNKKLIGLVSFYANDLIKKKAFITLVCVKPQFGGKGIAKQLINNTIKTLQEKEFKEVSLEVEGNNTQAIDLYIKLGFIEKSKKLNQLILSKIL